MKFKVLYLLFVWIAFIDGMHNTNFNSLYEESIVSPRNDQINIEFQYGAISYDVTTSIFGGLVQSFTSMVIVSTSTNPTGFAQIQSNNKDIYDPGHETHTFFTALWPNGSALNSTQWIGQFNAVNGIAVGYNDSSFSILFRQGGVDSIISQTSFNKDPLNGTGASGFSLNTATLNVFRISYGWLGANQINFYILDQTEKWILFHTINRTNSFTAPTFTNPILPITAQVKKTSGASDLAIATASWSTANVTGQNNAGNRYFTAGRASMSVTTEAFVLAIRNKTTYQSQVNLIPVILTFVAIGTIQTIATVVIIRLYKNAPLSNLFFTDVDTQNSVMQFNTQGSYTLGTGTLVCYYITNLSNGVPYLFLRGQNQAQKNNLIITLMPGESLTVTGESLLGNIAPVSSSIAWVEQFA